MHRLYWQRLNSEKSMITRDLLPGGFSRLVRLRLYLVLLVALAWGHTVSFRFVWDDRYFIEDLPSIRSLHNIPAMFYRLDAQSSYPAGFVLFRPLRTLHYALLFALGGGKQPQPWLFHLANVIWHAACVLLLFGVMLRLLARFAGPDGGSSQLRVLWIAWLTAAALAVHPVVSETVCWAKSLDDLMATAFTLAAFLALLHWNGSLKPYVMSLLLFTLAVYSKVSAVPFAMVVFLICFFVQRRSLRQSVGATSGFAVVATIFLLHRHLVIGRTSQTSPLSGTYGQTLVDMMPVVTHYLRLLAGLPPFCADYSYLKGGHAFWSAQVLAGLILLVFLAVLCLRSFTSPGSVLNGLGLAWIGLFLLPVSNVVPTMQYLAERFLYLPLIGGLMVLGSLMLRAKRWQVICGCYAALAVVWTALAWNRSWIWKDEVTLFVHTALENPSSARVENNAVAAVLKLPHMHAVYRVSRPPGQTPMLIMQNAASLAQADWPRVRKTLEQLHGLFPENPVVANALGFAHVQQRDFAGALPFFEFAAAKRPTDPDPWTNLGQAYLELQQWAKAEKALQDAVKLKPDHLSALKSLSKLYWLRGDYAHAIEVLLKLQQLEPDDPDHKHWIDEARRKLGAP